MYKTTIQILLPILLLLPALAQGGDASADDSFITPETIEGVTIVSAEGLIEKVQNVPALVLIDARIREDRAQGYIEGSLSMPDVETTCTSLARVLPAFDTPVLFYCNGVKCGRSARAAIIARDCGYTNILWYRNGMEDWQREEYPLVQ